MRQNSICRMRGDTTVRAFLELELYTTTNIIPTQGNERETAAQSKQQSKPSPCRHIRAPTVTGPIDLEVLKVQPAEVAVRPLLLRQHDRVCSIVQQNPHV